MSERILLKGQSHEIDVCFFGAFWTEKNPFIIPAEGLQLILSTFSCLILKLNSPSGTAFGMFFAYEEYRTDDSNSQKKLTRPV